MLQIVTTTLLALGIASAASPVVVRKSPVTLPLARHYNFTPGVTIPEVDRARIHALKEYTRRKAEGSDGVWPVPATNAVVTYTTVVRWAGVIVITVLFIVSLQVAIGTPPTDCTCISAMTIHRANLTVDTLLIDTGSSNTWVGALTPYATSASTVDTGAEFVRYTSDFVNPPFDQILSSSLNMGRDW